MKAFWQAQHRAGKTPIIESAGVVFLPRAAFKALRRLQRMWSSKEERLSNSAVIARALLDVAARLDDTTTAPPTHQPQTPKKE